MSNANWSLVNSIWSNFREIFRTLRQQKLMGALVLVIVLSIIAMIFSFIAFSPILSPFLYPLF